VIVGELVVVIEADRGLQEVLTAILEEHGYRSRCCGDAAIAARVLRRARPAAILLDPGMEDGWNLLLRLRARARLRLVPIIVCTTDLWALNEQRALLAEHNCASISMPFALATLLDALRRAVHSSRHGSSVD
jgi:DNA-binding response OmpR family regulator